MDSPQGLEEVVSGSRPLESFLLALDESQRPIVERFTRRPAGPRIVKGGPGTGKSTVALYCLQSLVRSDQIGMFSSRSPPRILFTTYTRALVAASRHLLGELGVDADSVDFHNVDSLAKHHAKSSWANPVYRASDPVWKDTVEAVLPDLKSRIAGFSWTEGDSQFLFDEMNLVIVGREISSLDEYLGTRRVGRRRLGRWQRRHVWEFAVAAWQELRDRERCLRAHLFFDAKETADPIYDYVFIRRGSGPPAGGDSDVCEAREGRAQRLSDRRQEPVDLQPGVRMERGSPNL